MSAPGQTIAGLTPTLCELMGISPPALAAVEPLSPVIQQLKAQSGPQRIDKCLIYAPDALGTLFLEKHPGIFEHVRRCAPIAIELRSMTPPKTPVCFASMFTGAPPQAHGIRLYERPVLACDTLFDVLLRAGKRPAIAAVRDSSCDLIFRGRRMDYFSEAYDPQVTDRAIALLEAGQHDLILAYHQEYDDCLHESGTESARSLAAAQHHAADFVRLCRAFNQHWSRHERLIVFAPDHGGHDFLGGGKGGHGDDIPEDMLVTHFYGAYPAAVNG